MTDKNRKIGYARVSTEDQNLDLQRDALRAAGCDVVYEDRVSGAVNGGGRKGLSDALAACGAGDVLVVWKLDRVGCKGRMESPQKCRGKIPQVAGFGRRPSVSAAQLRSWVAGPGGVAVVEG